MLSFSACTQKSEPEKFKNPIFNQPIFLGKYADKAQRKITPTSVFTYGEYQSKPEECFLINNQEEEVTLYCPTQYMIRPVFRFINRGELILSEKYYEVFGRDEKRSCTITIVFYDSLEKYHDNNYSGHSPANIFLPPEINSCGDFHKISPHLPFIPKISHQHK